MSRPNTDKVKRLINTLSQEISKHGEEGKSELRQLFEARPPQAILSLPPGPTRGALAAELISDMRGIARELAEAKAARGEIASRSSGKIDRFIYEIGELSSGEYIVKITRKGRRVIEDEKAPRIYDNKHLLQKFRSKDEAEIAARRVVNTAMIWYAERGITPREKTRRSKSAGRGVQRRTSSDRASISREKTETARIKHKKRQAQDRKKRLLEEKVSGRKSNPSRNLRHIPRKNPGGLFSFKHSEDSAETQAKKSLATYKKYKDKWEDSLKSDRPDFRSIMRAYDALENARANLFLAGKQKEADMVSKIRVGVRDSIIGIFKTCYKHLSKRGSFNANPGMSTHAALGDRFIKRAGVSMGKYESNGSVSCLLDAYKNYELAAREYKNSGQTPGLIKATAGAKKAREELKKKTRG